MRPEKQNVVEDLLTKLNASPFLFVTDYTGLRVDQFSELRIRLANAGARCHVVKNTFLRRAAKDAGLPELGELKGQTAIIVGDKDVAAAAKVVKTFVGEFQKPIVKLGVIDRCPPAKCCWRSCSASSRPRPRASSAPSTNPLPLWPACFRQRPPRMAPPPSLPRPKRLQQRPRPPRPRLNPKKETQTFRLNPD